MLKICQRWGPLHPPIPMLRHHQPRNTPLSIFQSLPANQQIIAHYKESGLWWSLSDNHVHFSAFRHSSASFHSPIMLPGKNTMATESWCHFASHKIRVSVWGSIPTLAFALWAKRLHLINSCLCQQTYQPTSTETAKYKGSFPYQQI